MSPPQLKHRFIELVLQSLDLSSLGLCTYGIVVAHIIVLICGLIITRIVVDHRIYISNCEVFTRSSSLPIIFMLAIIIHDSDEVDWLFAQDRLEEVSKKASHISVQASGLLNNQSFVPNNEASEKS
jgi:hypothetical protein